MCDAGVMAKHNPVPLGRWLRPRVEDERRTVPTSREEREGSFPFSALLQLAKMEVARHDPPLFSNIASLVQKTVNAYAFMVIIKL